MLKHLTGKNWQHLSGQEIHPSLLAAVLLLTMMEAMRRGLQVGLAVVWHNYIGITCYIGNWINDSFSRLEPYITVMRSLHT